MTRAGGAPTSLQHILSSSGMAYLARLVAIIVGLASLPIGFDVYGLLRFGVWLTAASLTQHVNAGALGMPLAVLTAVASSNRRTHAARVAAYAVRLVFLSGVGLLIVGVVLWRVWPSWTTNLFGEVGSTRDVTLAVAVLLCGTFFGQPLLIFANVLAGRHRIMAREAYEISRHVGRLASLLIAASVSSSLTVLAILTVCMDLSIGIVRALHVTVVERVPVHYYLFRRGIRTPGLLRSGLRFLALQIEVTIIRNTDNLVISGVLGPSLVSIYAAPFKLVSAAMSLIEAIQAPLWPSYGDARAREDWVWIRQAHGRVIAFGLFLGGAVWIGAVGFAEPVIHAWLGSDFPVDDVVVLALGGYVFVGAWVNTNAILLNALDATQSQVISGGVEAAVNVSLSLLLAPVVGLAGVASGTTLGAASVSSWALPLDVRNRSGRRVPTRLGELGKATLYTVPLVLLVFYPSGLKGSPVLTLFALVVHAAMSAWQFRSQWRDSFGGAAA